MNMKKTPVIIVVLVVIVALFFVLNSKKLEAPAPHTTTTQTKTEQPTTVKEFVITGQNFSFTPSVITVKKGDKVKITFKNVAGFHDFTIDGFGVATRRSQSPATEFLEFTADKTGSFEYYCSVGTHRLMGMKGILKVE